MPDVVDLRSDTLTRPTPPMRQAMASAEVGDDVYGEDPTVNRLQDEVAERFGREAALFVPSGVMANQIGIKVLAPAGTEVVLEADAHIVAFESGASAMSSGVQFFTTRAPRGILTAALVEESLRPASFPYTQTSLVAVEQTTNRHGGTIYPLEELRAIRELADARGLAVYMDGARIFNAAVGSGVSVADYAATVDMVSFCVSKALGAPVGSLIVGDAATIEQAHGWRHRFGGAMRQVGVLAAAGLYALEHHVERLVDDHANARFIAEVVAGEHPDAVDPDAVETNIVYIDTGATAAAELVDKLADDGIRVGSMGPSVLRLVTHLDVDEAGCRRAAETLARLL